MNRSQNQNQNAGQSSKAQACKSWKFEGALLEEGWVCPAYLETDEVGRVVEISSEPKSRSSKLSQVPEGGGGADHSFFEDVPGFLIPGFVNAHSHAFQYCMAGLTESYSGSPSGDNFWSWRESMYSLAQNISAEQMEAMATLVYSRMLKNGYTHVVEFHYLQNHIGGDTHDLELSKCIIKAAQNVGMGLTLVPVFYHQGNFNEKAQDKQRRFLFKNEEDYFEHIKAVQNLKDSSNDFQVGVGIHSLRAASPKTIEKIISNYSGKMPFHIHGAEQKKEVLDCIDVLGARPVEWLLDRIEKDSNFNIVHGTHLNRYEINRLVELGVQIILCPSTEGNLGDGFFPIAEYWQQGGKWAIGSDSHVGLNPLEELRWLDYGHRLNYQQRNVGCGQKGDESGNLYYREALGTGRRSAGLLDAFPLAEGLPLSGLVIDSSAGMFSLISEKKILSRLMYLGDSSFWLGRLRNGSWQERKGFPLKGEPLEVFRECVSHIGAQS